MQTTLVNKFLSVLTSPDDTTVEAAMTTIEKEQKVYTTIVSAHYDKDVNTLFKPNRIAKTEEAESKEFAQDLEDFLMLIIHCLKSGSAEILYDYCINPIFRTQDGIKRLVYNDDIQRYANVFYDWKTNGTVNTALGKMCIQALEEECRKYMTK